MTEQTRLAWFHCFSGIAGDMALGSLIDAGADIDEVRSLLRRLPVDGWSLDVEPVLRGGIAATNVHVIAPETNVVHRTAAHIIGLVHEARLPDRITQRAVATFNALAEVEGRLHRRPPSQVHFHEVGGIDAIIDVVGTCAALEVLDIDEVHASPVATGRGMVRSAHGLIPNPAPAVMGLLTGVPTYGIDIQVELTTPTGAALLAANAVSYGALPAMRIESSGFGAGDKILDDRPNLTQVVIGTRVASIERGQPVVLLEANVDDATGETLAHAITQLLRNPGREKQSVSDSSFDAWSKYYRQDENSPNAIVSYYGKGSLVGLCLDLHIRSQTGGRKSLDDVMLALWKKHGRSGAGVAEDGIEILAEAVTRLKLKRPLERWLRSTAELPLADLLATHGVALTLRPAEFDGDKGGRRSVKSALALASRPVLGVRGSSAPGEYRVSHVLDEGTAQRAGLSAGDVIVAFDGLRVGAGGLEAALAGRKPGQTVQMHVFRRDELMVLDVELGAPHADTCMLGLDDAGDSKRLRQRWLGTP